MWDLLWGSLCFMLLSRYELICLFLGNIKRIFTEKKSPVLHDRLHLLKMEFHAGIIFFGAVFLY